MTVEDRQWHYKQGYQDGGSDMEQAKQIIIDSLLKQIEQIRADAIEKVKKYIRLKTKYAEHPKDDYILAHDMYEWLDEQLKENK